MQLAVPITGLYAGIQALLAIFLAFQVGQLRGKLGVSLGDGSNAVLNVAVRRHGNWAEHVPFALLLMGLLELNGGGTMLLHGLGIALTLGRIAHPLGLRSDKLSTPQRIAGAGLTVLVTLVAAVALIVKAL
ncbi:MAG: MAPEG family protein [Myxococcota bacterium]|jgi:hypothetical protein